MSLTVVADSACHTGEGPLWHPDENALYWTDIPAGKLLRLDWSTREYETVYDGIPVGGMTLQADGSLALFCAHGQIQIWRDGKADVIIPEIAGESDNRFNDVIADPCGRVFAGTMSTADRAGKLYRIDPDLTITPVVEDVGCSNGMGFNAAQDRFYYVDSTRRLISMFDYTAETGELSNRRDFVREADAPGVPDGMTVDNEDHVWVGFWDGNRLVRYDPNGHEVARIEFPVRKVSCLTFGGPDYDDVFATTAGGNQREIDGVHAGALFHLQVGVRGRPEFRSQLGH